MSKSLDLFLKKDLIFKLKIFLSKTKAMQNLSIVQIPVLFSLKITSLIFKESPPKKTLTFRHSLCSHIMRFH